MIQPAPSLTGAGTSRPRKPSSGGRAAGEAHRREGVRPGWRTVGKAHRREGVRPGWRTVGKAHRREGARPGRRTVGKADPREWGRSPRPSAPDPRHHPRHPWQPRRARHRRRGTSTHRFQDRPQHRARHRHTRRGDRPAAPGPRPAHHRAGRESPGQPGADLDPREPPAYSSHAWIRICSAIFPSRRVIMDSARTRVPSPYWQDSVNAAWSPCTTHRSNLWIMSRR